MTRSLESLFARCFFPPALLLLVVLVCPWGAGGCSSPNHGDGLADALTNAEQGRDAGRDTKGTGALPPASDAPATSEDAMNHGDDPVIVDGAAPLTDAAAPPVTVDVAPETPPVVPVPPAGCTTGRKCNDQCIADDVPCGTVCVANRTLCNGACIPAGMCCADKDCPRCQECAAGACRNQAAGQDKKSECGGRACNAGACRACNPGGAQTCMDNVLKKCDADGSGYSQVDACGGKGCTGSSCKSCTPNQGECSGNVFRKCNGSGTGFGASQTCDMGCTPEGCVACNSPVTCYRDADKDGFGDPKDSKKVCGTCDAGFVTNKTDCYDANAMAYPRGPTTGFDDYFPVHRGDGSFDYTCDGRAETTPQDPDKARCMGLAATCEIVRMDFDASVCGTLVPVVTCSCNDNGMGCMKACHLLGAPGTRIQVKCR
jgi:hypothetical protein